MTGLRASAAVAGTKPTRSAHSCDIAMEGSITFPVFRGERVVQIGELVARRIDGQHGDIAREVRLDSLSAAAPSSAVKPGSTDWESVAGTARGSSYVSSSPPRDPSCDPSVTEESEDSSARHQIWPRKPGLRSMARADRNVWRKTAPARTARERRRPDSDVLLSSSARTSPRSSDRAGRSQIRWRDVCQQVAGTPIKESGHAERSARKGWGDVKSLSSSTSDTPPRHSLNTDSRTAIVLQRKSLWIFSHCSVCPFRRLLR